MNTIFKITMLGETKLAHLDQLLRIIQRSYTWARTIPVPGDLLLLPSERGVPPTVYHVNRRIFSTTDKEQEFEIVVEEGSAGLFAGREFLHGVVEKMVHDASKKVLNERDQIKLITDTIYEATKGRVIYG